ncbi:MAG TPA: M20/M25/M40 family metallo-hydrolase, partial [Spirochaetia bacterium]|nr:M20/M25/M40 family metallo-hydrolase [Spirochaetia bacterium]
MEHDRTYRKGMMRRTDRFLAAATVFLATLSGCGTPLKGESVTATELADHVTFLAADDRAGRLTGGPGIREAESYITHQFETDGLLRLPGQTDLRDVFFVYERGFDSRRTQLYLSAGGRTLAARYGANFIPFPFSGSGAWLKEVVFAGYGITAPELEYDDYRGLDVRGKIVLVLRYEPARFHDGRASSKEYTAHAVFTSKLKNALMHGAAGVLFHTDELYSSPTDSFYSTFPRMSLSRFSSDDGWFGGDDAMERSDAPALKISGEAARLLFAAWRRTPAEMEAALANGSTPAGLNLPNAFARIIVRRHEPPVTHRAVNVMGYIPGSDPGQTKPWIIIAAHYDHIGTREGSGDTIYNGADDNASGTAGILELAEAFSRYSPPPRHNLLFVTFSAEEVGLLGSRAFLEKKILSPEKIAFMVNLDMIGRNPDRTIEIICRDQVHATMVERYLASEPIQASVRVEQEDRTFS